MTLIQHSNKRGITGVVVLLRVNLCGADCAHHFWAPSSHCLRDSSLKGQELEQGASQPTPPAPHTVGTDGLRASGQLWGWQDGRGLWSRSSASNPRSASTDPAFLQLNSELTSSAPEPLTVRFLGHGSKSSCGNWFNGDRRPVVGQARGMDRAPAPHPKPRAAHSKGAVRASAGCEAPVARVLAHC